MEEAKIKPRDMAQLLGDVSVSGLGKWMRGERVPRPDQQRRIYEITEGKVTPNDFVLDGAAA